MDLKKLDHRISFLSRAAKKELLAKFLLLTNDSFIWLEATQKERSNFDTIPEISGEESPARWAQLFKQTRKSSLRLPKDS